MLSIDFSTLKTESPELVRTWALLERWLRAHEGANVISPGQVAQFAKRDVALTFNDVIDLSQALEVLAEKGFVRRCFAVATQTGQLLHPYYRSRSEIPSVVQTSAAEWVNTKDAEIKSVFVGTAFDE